MFVLPAWLTEHPRVEVSIDWEPRKWMPVGPVNVSDGDESTGYDMTWYEQEHMCDGPQPFGQDGPLSDLHDKVAEVLENKDLAPSIAIEITICGWALLYHRGPL